LPDEDRDCGKGCLKGLLESQGAKQKRTARTRPFYFPSPPFASLAGGGKYMIAKRYFALEFSWEWLGKKWFGTTRGFHLPTATTEQNIGAP
jgi:hypothetical protein